MGTAVYEHREAAKSWQLTQSCEQGPPYPLPSVYHGDGRGRDRKLAPPPVFQNPARSFLARVCPHASHHLPRPKMAASWLRPTQRSLEASLSSVAGGLLGRRSGSLFLWGRKGRIRGGNRGKGLGEALVGVCVRRALVLPAVLTRGRLRRGAEWEETHCSPDCPWSSSEAAHKHDSAGGSGSAQGRTPLLIAEVICGTRRRRMWWCPLVYVGRFKRASEKSEEEIKVLQQAPLHGRGRFSPHNLLETREAPSDPNVK